MAEQNPTLAAFYHGWGNYQNQLVKAVTPLTEAQLALTVASQQRSMRDLVLHIIATRVSWFHNVADFGSPDLAPMAAWDLPGAGPFTTKDIVAGLETSWRLMMEALAAWTPQELQTPFTVQGRTREHTYTRQWIVWHVIEHDLHHGGELSFALGIHGLIGIDLD